MREIQPLDIWSNGETKTAVCLKLYISYDNLESIAALQYSLCDIDGVTIYEGQVMIAGDDYLNWGATSDSNNEAYVIAATQLNLSLV
jgi:hypothetical protein